MSVTAADTKNDLLGSSLTNNDIWLEEPKRASTTVMVSYVGTSGYTDLNTYLKVRVTCPHCKTQNWITGAKRFFTVTDNKLTIESKNGEYPTRAYNEYVLADITCNNKKDGKHIFYVVKGKVVQGL